MTQRGIFFFKEKGREGKGRPIFWPLTRLESSFQECIRVY